MSDQVRLRLDHWKRRLIDLTKRNRLLNFKPTRVTTIHVVDELPAEAFRTLYLEQRAMVFLPLPEETALQAALSDVATDEHADASAPQPILTEAIEFQRQDRARLPGHQLDTILRTELSEQKLDHSLLRIFQSSSSLLEDQGVNLLFLTLGMVEWFESDDSDVVLRAPLILLPVQLTRQTARGGFSLRATGDDPLVNPALSEKLRLDFRVMLPELSEALEDFDPDGFLSGVQQAIADRKRWRVTNDINLGLFTFQKFVMYSSMERHEEQYAAHPVVRALCLGKGERLRPLPDEVREARLDEVFTPETTHQVLDADSSQQRALLAVKTGHDLALEGPPGTGKSQTIANLIAGALADGRSVLFVSEKMAALQVVYGRLATLGLHDFCLELHSNKANKRAVIAELARVLDSPHAPDHRDDTHLDRLSRLRDQLNGYAEDLHAPFGQLAVSPYFVLGELARLAAAPVVTAEIATPDGRSIAACDRPVCVLSSV